jgi:hypothetical protein
VRLVKRLPVLIAGATVTAGLLGNAAAYADDYWYSQSAPLTASDDGTVRAGAYGHSYVDNGSYARVNSRQKDYRPGGHKVYVDTDYKYWVPNSVNVLAWVEKASKETTRTDTATWTFAYTRHGLLGEADRVRAVSHVCEDQPLSGDPCSVNVVKTFSY